MVHLDPVPKAFFFDVFGTCVDWRSSVTNAFHDTAGEVLSSEASIAEEVRAIAANMTREDWAEVAAELRASYIAFTRGIAKDPQIPYKTVDQHYYDATREILTTRGLLLPGGAGGSLFSDEQVTKLSRVWHFLDPWPDTCEGLGELNKRFSTCTLSNGNVALLQDMVAHGRMPFTHVFSAEMFQSYKPSPKVYLGAVAKMGLRPEECCMVAAHLDDLQAAKSNGLRTLYVERPREERHPELRAEIPTIVDVWVKEGEDGFVTAARRLGVASPT